MKVEVSPLLQSLDPQNTGIYNRFLAHALGLNEAVLYASLVAKFVYYNNRDMLDEDGSFYSTMEDLEESTSLTRNQQPKAIKKLEEYGLIATCLKGMPARRYFRVLVDDSALEAVLRAGANKCASMQKHDCGKAENKFTEKPKTSFRESSKQVCGKPVNMFSENQLQNISNKTLANNHTGINKKSADARPASKASPSVRPFDEVTSPELRDALQAFKEMRRAKRAPLTLKAEELCLRKLDQLASTDAEKIAILEQSIANSWSGVFPIHEEHRRPRAETPEDKVADVMGLMEGWKNGGF